MPDITDTIVDETLAPKVHKVDGQETEGQPLRDLIEADKYVRGVRSVSGGTRRGGMRGFRVTRAIPGGTV